MPGSMTVLVLELARELLGQQPRAPRPRSADRRLRVGCSKAMDASILDARWLTSTAGVMVPAAFESSCSLPNQVCNPVGCCWS